MAPSPGQEDRSERTETGSDRDNWCGEQEAVRERVAGLGKSLGLREVDSRSSARRNTRSIRRESVGDEKGPETRGQKDTKISKRKGKKKTRKQGKKTKGRGCKKTQKERNELSLAELLEQLPEGNVKATEKRNQEEEGLDWEALQSDIRRWMDEYGDSQSAIHYAVPSLYDLYKKRSRALRAEQKISQWITGCIRKQTERRHRGNVAKRVRKEERERVEKIRKVEKAREFKRLRVFMGIRVRICRLKRVSRRQRYESAQTTIEGDLGRYSSERKKQWVAAEQEFRPRRQLEDRERQQRQAVRQNAQRLIRKWKKAIEKGAKYGGDSEESCKELARRYVWGIEGIPQRNRVIKRVNRMWVEFQSSYAYQIRRAKVREAYVAEQRQGIIRAMKTRVDKTVIAQEIRESLSSGSKRGKKKIRLTDGLEGDWRSARRRKRQRSSCRKQKKEGGKRVSEKRDGQMRMLPHEVVDKLTWRREQRRRQLLARWEAPPPGPPEVENE